MLRPWLWSNGHAASVVCHLGGRLAGGWAGLSRSREAIDERLLLRIDEHSGLREEWEEELPMEVLKILQQNETKRFAQSDSARCSVETARQAEGQIEGPIERQPGRRPSDAPR
jgi:hypothetical protein